MRFHSRALAVALLNLTIAPAAVRAQSRYTVGGAVAYADPLGEFGSNVRRGFGLDGFGTIALEPTDTDWGTSAYVRGPHGILVEIYAG